MPRPSTLSTLILIFTIAAAAQAQEPRPKNQKLDELLEAAQSRNDYVPALQAIKAMGPDARDAIPALIKIAQQGTKQPTRTKNALEALAGIGKPAVPALIRALPSSDWILQTQIADTLGVIGPDAESAVPALTSALKYSHHAVRARAAHALGKIGAPAASSAVPGLIELFAAKTNTEGKAATEALGAIGAPAVPDLITQIKTKEGWERKYAIQALGLMGYEAAAAVPALIDLLDKPEVETATINALGQIGTPARSAAPAIAGCLAKRLDPDPMLRAFKRIEPRAADVVPALVASLRNPRLFRSKKLGVARYLASLGPEGKEAVPELVEMLKGRSATDLPLAADALGAIGPAAAAAVPELERLLDRPPDFVKNGTSIDYQLPLAIALGRIDATRKPRIKPILLAALKDRQSFNRLKATAAMGELDIDRKAAAGLLVALIVPEHGQSARDIAGFVGSFGPDARVAVPELETHLTNINRLHYQDHIRAALGLALISPEHREKCLARLAELWKMPPPFRPNVRLVEGRCRQIGEAWLAIGPEHSRRDAVPLLKEGLRNREPSVRRACAEILVKIDPEEAARRGIRIGPPEQPERPDEAEEEAAFFSGLIPGVVAAAVLLAAFLGFLAYSFLRRA